MNSKIMGTKIAFFRKQKGYTQTDLADILSVSNKTISRWETGDGFPEIGMLKPISAALDVDIDFLLSDIDLDQKNPSSCNRYHNGLTVIKILLIYSIVIFSVDLVLNIFYEFYENSFANHNILSVIQNIFEISSILFFIVWYKKLNIKKHFAANDTGQKIALLWIIVFFSQAFFKFFFRITFVYMINSIEQNIVNTSIASSSFAMALLTVHLICSILKILLISTTATTLCPSAILTIFVPICIACFFIGMRNDITLFISQHTLLYMCETIFLLMLLFQLTLLNKERRNK